MIRDEKVKRLAQTILVSARLACLENNTLEFWASLVLLSRAIEGNPTFSDGEVQKAAAEYLACTADRLLAEMDREAKASAPS